MSRYWPKIEDVSTAKDAVLGAVGASLFVSAVTALLAILSLIYKKPILGLDGWALVDAGLFALIAWRIHKMSRTWAVIGLALYSLEIGDMLINRPSGAVGILTIFFILAFIGGVRGAFAFHRYSKQEGQQQVTGLTGDYTH